MPARVLVVDDSSTVRKITQIVLAEDGHQVTAVADGHQAIELLRHTTFDLVLLDFVMPRMNGYQFAQSLRALENGRDLPIVLISARAEQIGERFMKQTGALDALAKPFSPDVLKSVVAHTLSRIGKPLQPSTLVRDDLHGLLTNPADDVDDDPHDPTMIVETGRISVKAGGVAILPPAQAKMVAVTRLADTIAKLLAPSVTTMIRDAKKITEGTLSDVIVGILSNDVLDRLEREVRAYHEVSRGNVGIDGQIALVPLAELMQLLRLQGQTGTLVVENNNAIVAITFCKGNVDLAVARNVSPEFLLGRYLVADGVLTREQLHSALAVRGEKSWLGEQLVKAGRITQEDLNRALMRQTSEVIYELLRWQTGRYRFEQGNVAPEAKSAELGLPVESIVLEGYRRVDEWRVIQEDIRSFDEVFARNEVGLETVGPDRLSPVEKRVLEMLDGKRPVRELIQNLAMNSFDCCQVLYRLFRSNVIRRKPAQ